MGTRSLPSGNVKRHIVSSSIHRRYYENRCAYTEDSKMEKCKDGTCEFNPVLNRNKVKRTPEQEQYERLYAEIELPKLLKEMNNHGKI
jgi:hypothetical protein